MLFAGSAGGGPVYNIISRSLQDAKKLEGHKKEIDDHKKEIKELRAIVERLEKEISSNKKPDAQREGVMLMPQFENAGTSSSALHQSPEDVLRVFMMENFVGSHILDDLVVPGLKKSK